METGMRMLLPRLPGFWSKVLELAGAGLASAIGAFLLSQIVSKPAPSSAPAPQVVQLAPADAELIGIVRADQAALLAELQKMVPESSRASAPPQAQASKTAAATPPRPAKTAQPVPLPREPKTRAANASYQGVAEAPLPIQPASVGAMTPEARAVSGEPPESGRVISTLKQIPSWFAPNSEKLSGDAPRPPMPVGQFVSSAM
jgi:hypothetical protein